MKKNLSVYLFGIGGVVLAGILILMSVLIASGSFRYRKTPLVIQTASSSKTFDGRVLRSKKWSLVSGKLSDEHELEVEVLGEQTDVGSSENYARIVIRDISSGADVTDQYDIETHFGKLEVFRRKLTFRSESNRAVYDGNAHPFPYAMLASGWLASGETWEGYDFAEPTDAGKYKNSFRVRITNSDGEDVTENYEVNYDLGEIIISYGRLVIESGSASKEYDGVPLSNPDYSIRVGSVQADHKIQMKAVGSITVVGICNNVVQAQITDARGMDVTEFYEIEYATGTLTITPRSLVVITDDVTRPYYDTSIPGDWHLVDGELLDGEQLKIVTTQQLHSFWQPGFYENQVYSYSVWNPILGDVSDCYRLISQHGKLTLTE